MDDTKETIWAYFFRENTALLKNISKGDIVQIVGKIYEWRNEKQLSVEAASKVSPNFWVLHRLELVKYNRHLKEQLKTAEKIKSEEKNLKKAKEKAESMGLNPEIIEALYERDYVKEKDVDTTLIEDKVLSAIERLDEGEGVELDDLISEINEFSPEEIDAVVRDLLTRGEIFEPKINRYMKV